MKLLNGLELVGFIKERQAHAVRGLIQAEAKIPRLAIIRTNPDPVVDSYMRLKTTYGKDILIEVDVHTVDQSEAVEEIKTLDEDPTVHGIIVQIPLPKPSQTDEILNTVSPDKDVDGLGGATVFDPATPVAINWLLAGYNVDLKGKTIVIVGQGRLVGSPLTRMWRDSGYNVLTASLKTANLADLVLQGDIIITATGVPNLITSDMIKDKAVIVDAGVATDKNGLVGDVADNVRARDDIMITPEKGGVGPLTVCALFENVILAARQSKLV